MNPTSHEETLFQAALPLTGTERAALLDRACAGDPALRARVGALLAAHDQPDTVFGTDAGVGRPTISLDLTSDPLDDLVGQTIGRYKLLEKIGEGGCGVVYVAEQTEPVRRRVALKIIKLGMDTKQVVARFEAERQALAMMDHPNIAKVLDAGTTEGGKFELRTSKFGFPSGRPYFVMELVRGIKITEYCEREQLSTQQRLELFIKVCQAIQHAHQKGIIHRDIKPSNILVTLHDGVPVPKVIDFGIAKATEGRLTEATVYTQLHQFIGTPAYMSPEQAEMSGLDIDTRSDIYSLGVLLYELLTGVTPFDARELMSQGIDAMRRTIREQEPPRPSTRLTQELARLGLGSARSISHLGSARGSRAGSGGSPEASSEPRSSGRRAEERVFGGAPKTAREARALPNLMQSRALPGELRTRIHALRGDLDWIVMKCLEKDRGRRYETANGLAADLKRHLNSEPVVARPPSAAYRFQKAFRRNRTACTAAAAVLITIVAGAVVSVWQARLAIKEGENARQAEKQAWEQTVIAEHALVVARQKGYVSEMGVAFAALAENNLGRARELLDRQRPRVGEEDFRGFEWRHLWQLCQSHEIATFTDESAFSAGFSPDGRLFAYGADALVVRETASMRIVRSLGFDVATLAFAPRDRLLAAGGTSGVTFWDVDTWQLVRTLPEAVQIAFSPDERWFAAWISNRFRVWDARTWRVLGDCPGAPVLTGNIRQGLAFSPDGQNLLTIAGERFPPGDHFRVWSLPSLQEAPEIWLPDGETSALAFSPDGTQLLTGLYDGRLVVWDFATRTPVATRREHKACLRNVMMAADGQTFTTASADQTIIVWDSGRLEPRLRLRGHTGELWHAAMSPDGCTIVTGCFDGTTKVWKADSIAQDPVLAGPNLVAGFIDGGRSLIGVSTNAFTRWDVDTGARLDTPVPAIRAPILTLNTGRPYAVNPRATVVARGVDDGTVEAWGLDAGSLTTRRRAHDHAVSAMAFSPQGELLAVGSVSGEVKILDFPGQREGVRLGALAGAVNCVAFSPDGKRVAASGWSDLIWIWELATGQVVQLPGNAGPVFSVAFSPDGRLLASTTMAQNEVRLWESASGRLVGQLRGHVGGVASVAFSPDGKTLATGGTDRRVILWNVPARQELATLSPGSRLPMVDFSPDGRTLAVGDLAGGGRSIRIFRAPSLEEIAAMDAREARRTPAASAQPTYPQVRNANQDEP